MDERTRGLFKKWQQTGEIQDHTQYLIALYRSGQSDPTIDLFHSRVAFLVKGRIDQRPDIRFDSTMDVVAQVVLNAATGKSNQVDIQQHLNNAVFNKDCFESFFQDYDTYSQWIIPTDSQIRTFIVKNDNAQRHLEQHMFREALAEALGAVCNLEISWPTFIFEYLCCILRLLFELNSREHFDWATITDQPRSIIYCPETPGRAFNFVAAYAEQKLPVAVFDDANYEPGNRTFGLGHPINHREYRPQALWDKKLLTLGFAAGDGFFPASFRQAWAWDMIRSPVALEPPWEEQICVHRDGPGAWHRTSLPNPQDIEIEDYLDEEIFWDAFRRAHLHAEDDPSDRHFVITPIEVAYQWALLWQSGLLPRQLAENDLRGYGLYIY